MSIVSPKFLVSSVAVAALCVYPALAAAQVSKTQRPPVPTAQQPRPPQQNPAAPVVVPSMQTPMATQDADVPVVILRRGDYSTRTGVGRYRYYAPSIVPDPPDRWSGGPARAPGAEGYDQDGDTRRAIAAGGDDCDDNDPQRAPGRIEVADLAGHDEDCDPTTVGERDQDGDGFTSWTAMNIMTTASGRPFAVYRGDDCDDARSDVYPGAAEIVGDERDNDCNGAVDDLVFGHGAYCAPTASVKASVLARARERDHAPEVCAAR